MTQPSPDADASLPQSEPIVEEPLTAFLRQHAPVPPVASPHLEQQIMLLVAATPLTAATSAPDQRSWWWSTGLSSVLAASTVLAVWVGQWLLGASMPETTALSRLEVFWEGNWQGLVVPPTTESLASQADWLILSRSSDVTQE